MEWCRDYFRTAHKSLDVTNLFATLVACDLKAGSYISAARAHRENNSHALEPNCGKEEEALRKCLRVARKAVVLVEPVYELASAEAQARMRHCPF